MRIQKIIISALIGLSFLTTVFGQQESNPDQSLRGSGRVNPSTLAMEFDLPLGNYPGRGINVPISLSYSSKAWRMEFTGIIPRYGNPNGCNSQYIPRFAEDTASGWTTSLAVPYIEYTGDQTVYNAQGSAIAEDTCIGAPVAQTYYLVRRLVVHLPSGETHELRADADSTVSYPASPTSPADTWNTTFYAADGSNIKYIENSNTGTYKLLMPDGSVYNFANTKSPFNNKLVRKADRFTDRNGNYTTYYGPGSIDDNNVTHPNGYWKDTLGRSIPVPFTPEAPSAPTPALEPKVYTMPGMNGTTVTYKFHWKQLKGSSALESGLTNFADVLRYKGNAYPLQNHQWASYPADTYLFASGNGTDMVSGDIFNPIVLTEIELPNGEKYKFRYDVYGLIEKIEYPTGGEEKFDYKEIPSLSLSIPSNINDKTNLGVFDRKVLKTSGDTSPYHWTYSAVYKQPMGYKITINNPDGTMVERFLHRGKDTVTCCPASHATFGYDNGLAGMSYEERVYDSAQPKNLVSKTLTHWTKTSFGFADWHPRVTHQETHIYDPSGNGDHVWATTKYEYEDLTAFDKPLLRKMISEYEFQASSGSSFSGENPGEDPDPDPTPVPTPVPPDLIRTAETTYLIYDTVNYPDSNIRQKYIDKNMVGLATSSVVKNPAGIIVAKSETKYDDTANYPVLSSGSTTNWQAPNEPNYRGNPNTSRVWDSTKGADTSASAYVETHAQFDNFGNLRKGWDGRGNYSEIQYTDNYTDNINRNSYALPTATISYSGANGTGTQFTTSTKYDFNTGLLRYSTDANNQTSEIQYNDALLRPTKAIAPNGHQTITEYGVPDSFGVLQPLQRFVKVKTQIDGQNWKEGYSWFDGLGRTVKTQSVDSDGDVFVETEFDYAGRPLRVTNPFRASETKLWTTNVYDEAGRVKEVVTPDGAKVQTSYGVAADGNEIGTTVTVKDQALKERRSISDVRGQLIRVDEPTGSGLGSIDSPNQPTYYEYDLLSNLIKVKQGGTFSLPQQTRNFVYDSLSRLKSATNPESGLIQYVYDNNGNLATKTDARNVVTTYGYDALNRVLTRSYTAPQNLPNYEPTPTVTYTYDNLPNAKGKLTKVTNGTSITEYQAFNILGRVKQSQQWVDGVNYGDPMTYTYNLSGAMIEQKYPSGRVVKNVLDDDGDLSIVQSKKNQTAGYWDYAKNFTFTAAGAVSSMQLGNGKWESTQFNSRLQPTQIALGTVQNGTDKLKLDFTYNTPNQNDNNGNVLSQTITVPTETINNQTYAAFTAVQTYTYDSLNRIKDAKEMMAGAQEWKQTFDYDRYGNRRFDTGTDANGNKTTTLAPGCAIAVCNPQIDPATNKLIGYSFDASGNTKIDAENRQFIYDGENKQVEVKDQYGASIGKYFYDGDGKRVKKISATETTNFVYNAGGQLVAEYSTQIAQGTNAKVSYLTNDHLGSPRITTDKDGQVVSRRDFQPFGEEITRAGYGTDSVRQKFTSYERDNETELDFAQARMFGSGFGRFTSPDPILSSATLEEPQSWNRYSYVLNNPLVFTDPTGMFIWTNALGGDVEDDDLTQHFTDEANKITDKKKRNKALKKIDKKVENIIKQRNQIRAGIEAAKGLLNSNKLSESQKSEIRRSIDVYGEEGDDNNVIVGQQANRNGATIFGEDGRIIVTLGKGNNAQEIAVQFIHEGSHVADDVAFNNGVAGSDISLFATETRAWTVSAYAAQGFGLKSYPSSLPKNLRVWKEGWSEVDISTGVANRLAGEGYSLTPQKQGDSLSVIKAKNIETVKTRNPIWNWY